jgi:putative hydrolase of the HAD superfamily
MIRDIVFDLGKVLCPFDWKIAYRRLLPHLPAEKACLLLQDRKAFEEFFREPSIALETGIIDFGRFQLVIQEALGISLNADEFRLIWCDIFQLDEEMVALGESLSRRYRTWLASNTNQAHYEWILARFPRVAFFRDAALSYELGVMKPHPDYYEKVIRKFEIVPAHSVFIDDLEQNIEGALRAGMNAVLFRGREQLLDDLRRLGVEVPPTEKQEE